MRYKKIPKITDSKTKEIFWAKVHKTDTCWLWIGCVHSNGYGRFFLTGEDLRAHRVSYVMSGKKISANKLLRHTCDNPTCVRPSHLRLGDHHSNAWDAISRGRDTNTKTKHKRTSRYRGVSWRKDIKKWRVCINNRILFVTVGNFHDEKEAALAYNKAAKKHYGKKAVLNVV